MQLLKKEPLIKEMQLLTKRSVSSLKIDCCMSLAVYTEVRRLKVRVRRLDMSFRCLITMFEKYELFILKTCVECIEKCVHDMISHSYTCGDCTYESKTLTHIYT